MKKIVFIISTSAMVVHYLRPR